MHGKLFRTLQILAFTFAVSLTGTQAQTARGNEGGYSESVPLTRSRTARTQSETDPARLLRAARTIYIEPNEEIDAEYLQYKLGKYTDFQQWKLSMVKDKDKADLILTIHRTALNYLFSIEDRESSIVVTNGKTVAINGLVAAEEIAKVIIKRMRNVRALPTDEP